HPGRVPPDVGHGLRRDRAREDHDVRLQPPAIHSARDELGEPRGTHGRAGGRSVHDRARRRPERAVREDAMHVISVDPGLDGIGVAVWDAHRFDELRREIRPELAAALRALVGVFLVTTAPGDPIDVRLAEIVSEMQRVKDEFNPAIAYVEMPAYTGDYYDEYARSRRSNVNKLYMGLGAVLAGLGAWRPDLHVVTIRAGQGRKIGRDAIVEENARVARIRLPEGPRGGARTDEVDAIWIGAYGLTERLNMDLKERGAMLEATAAGEAR